MKALWLS
ncbi:hypothetical protein Zm00014a_010148 [Zea mays]|nr:hypothetical protein Zm00014a_010148 [Zea mays]